LGFRVRLLALAGMFCMVPQRGIESDGAILD
jgi:hypothetical protein